MLYSDNMHTTSTEDKFFFFDETKVPFSLEQLFSSLYASFLLLLGITAEEMIAACKVLAIPYRSLLDYGTWTSNKTFLVKEKGVYTEKWDRTYQRMKRTYWNVYVTTASFNGNALTEISRYFVKQRYPWLWDIALKETKPRFSENICKLPTNIDTKIDDIPHEVLFDNDLTIKDLIKIYTEDGYKESTITKYGVNVYYGSDNVSIYLKVLEMGSKMGNPSLGLSLSDLQNKDWNAVCERTSQELDGKVWRWVKQSETKWFSSPLVEEVKKHFQ